MVLLSPETIQKEKIPDFDFLTEEVLVSDFDKDRRKEDLFRAMVLGNTYRKKVQITFDTRNGSKAVETTVWAATDQNIILKGGIYVPICCIRKISFIA